MIDIKCNYDTKTKLTISYLSIEVTRRCNMQCAHCMRGEAENKDMQKETIDKLLTGITHINELTFTGGEPTLNVPLMKYVLNELKRRKITLGSFFIATNGLEVTDEFLLFCIDMFAYVGSCGYYSPEENYCGIALSKDRFHSEIPEENEYRLKSLSIYSNIKDWYSNGKPSYKPSVLGIGRGGNLYDTVEFSVDTRKQNTKVHYDLYYTDDTPDLTIEDNICITVNGDVLTDCDYEYESDENICIGNVHENTLYDILYNKISTQDA